MQAVLNFLLEYFYWILGVLVVLLITVIGFLADTKRKKKMREKNSSSEANSSGVDLNNMNVGEMNNDLDTMNTLNNMTDINNETNNQNMNVMPNMNDLNSMNNINMNMNMGVNNMNTMPDVNMMNNQTMNVANEQQLNAMPNTNNTPAASIESVQSNDSFFVPTSEQTPSFAPRDVTVPTPVETTPIMNNNTQPVNNWNMQANTQVSPVEVVLSTTVPEVQNSIPNFGNDVNINNVVNSLPNVEQNAVSSTFTVPETPAMPEQPVNMNVNVTPQVEPVVNQQVNNQIPNFGPSMNQVSNGQVAPNFASGSVTTNNLSNNNMNNLNG